MKKEPNYELIRKVGSGLTADVFQASSKTHGRVSVKIVQPSFYTTAIGNKLIQNEIKILAEMNHKNVLKLIQKIDNNKKVQIVTAFCQGGDLENYLKKKKRLTESETLKFAKSIAEGLIYLKQKKVIHRDLKLSNIFLKDSQPIIADFGFAVHVTNKDLMGINAGSPLYMPIQSLTSKKFSEKSDVFALGICIFEMLTGKTPWSAKSETQLIQKLKLPPKIPAQINEPMGKLILKCLMADPVNRPTIEEILKYLEQIDTPKTTVLGQINTEVTPKPTKKYQIKISKSISVHPGIGKIQKLVLKQKQNKNTSVKFNKSITVNQVKKILPSKKGLETPPTASSRSPTTTSQPTTSRNQAQFLKHVNPDEFTFLPSSVIIKFKFILHQYRKILNQLNESDLPPFLEEKDTLVLEMEQCKTELQFCRCIESFIRRLFRLTKNYKEHQNCLNSLEGLYTRVTRIMII